MRVSICSHVAQVDHWYVPTEHRLSVVNLSSQQQTVSVARPSTPAGIADGDMLAWGDEGTRLPEDFAALRMEANWVRLLTLEQLPAAGSATDGPLCTGPVQLLCRALRLAPASYRRFELSAARPDDGLDIEAAVFRDWDDRDIQQHRRGTPMSFGSAAELAAAMQQHAAAERLTVHLSADQQDIVVRRAVAAPADAVDVRHADVVTLEMDYHARYERGEHQFPADSSCGTASSPAATRSACGCASAKLLRN